MLTVRSLTRILSVVVVILFVVVLGLGVARYTQRNARDTADLAEAKTYFDYSQQDIDKLKAQQPTDELLLDDAYEWENNAYDLVVAQGSLDVDASKIYAYLTVAQMDAAALSLQAHGTFAGSFGPVSSRVLCESYPDSCEDISEGADAYSTLLADIVIAKVKERMAADNTQTRPYELKTGPQYWNGPAPQVGLSAGNFKPWFLRSSDQFRVAPPPDPTSATAQAQLQDTKNLLAHATTEEKATVVQWAGGPGTKTPPGQWLDIASYYLRSHDISLQKSLEIRAMEAMAMADAVIAVFDSKYAYQYPRPFMMDPSIVTIMPTPNHPSYPAGHATISWAAATILSHYLPEQQAEWERLAKEASNSRTIGGIHFPMDNDAGTTLGKNVANQALRSW